MEYKEIVKKDGRKIVFLSFEDFLKDYFHVRTMEEVESHAKGDEYVCHCPFCKAEGHKKHKLYLRTDLTTGFCFVCTRTFVNITDTVKPEVLVPRSISNFGMGPSKYIPATMNDPNFTIDQYNYEFDDFDETGYQYLLRRHGFFKDLYKVLGIKFWNGNVVIPFIHDGVPFYYQIRFTNNGKIRYYLPKVQPQKPGFCIERKDIDSRKRILIVEGVFDAIAALIQCPDYTPFAVLGSSISDYQISQLRDYSGYLKEIRIWMDETKISMGIADKVKQSFDYCPISIIKSNGPDPEEILKERLSLGKNIQWIKSKYKKDV